MKFFSFLDPLPFGKCVSNAAFCLSPLHDELLLSDRFTHEILLVRFGLMPKTIMMAFSSDCQVLFSQFDTEESVLSYWLEKWLLWVVFALLPASMAADESRCLCYLVSFLGLFI